ncbi:MAG: hypothetical protein JWR45_3368 [Blastococcus sp.]|jgi:hypothetical protein|nr:hypothetical protein [Blastococcus sp.]
MQQGPGGNPTGALLHVSLPGPAAGVCAVGQGTRSQSRGS